MSESTRCEWHTKRKRQREDRRRPGASERGYDAKWQKERARFLAQYPVCQWKDGCLLPSLHVHHIDGKGPLGPQGYDWTNLQALCPHHHNQITGEDHGWN